MNSFRFFPLAALTVLVAACDNRTTSSSSISDSAPDAGAVADAGAPKNEASSADAGTASNVRPSKRKGSIQLYSAAFASSSQKSEYGMIEATFNEYFDENMPSNKCTFSQIDTCEISKCAAGAPPPPFTVSAGDIDISGSTSPIVLKPSNRQYETYVSQTERLWTSGSTLTLTAKGDIVPAFKLSATAPETVTLLTPNVDTDNFNIKIGAPVELTWQNGGTSNVLIRLFAETNSEATTINCQFASKAGKANIPGAVTALLPLDPKRNYFVVMATSSATTSVGEYDITANFYTVGNTNAKVASGYMSLTK